MPAIIAALTSLGVIVLGWAFFLNARAIRRDVKKRFADIQTHLERRANAIMDDVLRPNRP